MTIAEGPAWPTRYLRVAAALLVTVALLAWVTPVNVASTNLVPFGCGSPAAPTGGELAEFVCTDQLDAVKTFAVVFLVVAGLLLLLSEVAAVRWGEQGWFVGVAVIAPLAVPLLLGSIVSLFLVVGAVGADGTLIRCGTAVAPATDTISEGLCGQLPERRLNAGLGTALLAGGLLAGGVYVGRGLPRRDVGASRRASDSVTGVGENE